MKEKIEGMKGEKCERRDGNRREEIEKRLEMYKSK